MRPCAGVGLGVKLGLCASLTGALMLSSCSVWCKEGIDEALGQTQHKITISRYYTQANPDELLFTGIHDL